MDLGQLNGATLHVPSTTTRITPEGLNICGVAESIPPPTDIVYIVDQTGSMTPTFIQVKGTDTTAWNSCNYSPNTPTLKIVGTVPFHGVVSRLISPAEPLDSVKASCAVAGDPYSMRSKVVQAAIRTQASEAHLSSAGTINFGPALLSTQESMTAMTDAVGIAKLLASMPLDSVGGTNYEPALDWARILLYGGHSGASWVPASPNGKKAIVMISDGQPTEGNWRNALKAGVKVDENGKTWTNDAATIPPVYAIYLGVNQLDGSVLDTLARWTKGAYYQIPPNKPDSLEQVLRTIVGQIIHEGSPLSLTITNRTNGQTSKSIDVQTNGASNLMPLDSLVALESGSNSLELVVQLTSGVQRASVTVVVDDPSTKSPKGLLDSVLIPRCGNVSNLTVKPDNSGLAWADAPDRNLQMSLSTAPINYATMPLGIVTRISKDTEQVSVPLLDRPIDPTLRAFGGQIPWQNLAAGRALAFDKVVRSAVGWDSARVVFRMPRDRRDTAVAYIALHRPPSAVLTMTESVNGPSGRIDVSVSDSGEIGPSVTVFVKGATGDSLAVKLLRGTGGVFQGNFPFQQGAAAILGDSILQSGLGAPSLDSVTGTYLAEQARTLIHLEAIQIPPSPPDLAIYLDEDGDGTFDHAVVHSTTPLRPGFDLRLPWPDSVSRVGVSLDQPLYSTDSTAATFRILTKVPLTTGAKTAITAQWRGDGASDWTDVKVVDRIAPVPLRAILRRGPTFDTLRIPPSEPIRIRLDSTGRLVSRWLSSGAFQALSPRSAELDSATGQLLLVFPSDSTGFQVEVGDSIRFASNGFVRDAWDNAPGLVARKVVVEGPDPAPVSAMLFDTDADGRADRVVIRLGHPLVSTDSVGFRWPDLSGGFQTRSLAVGAARSDSGGRILTFDIEPFVFGSTACPREGCQNLAWFVPSGPAGSKTSTFPLLDGVDPIVMDARFAYGWRPGIPDSLQLVFSEPLNANGSRSWIAWGRPGIDSLGKPVVAKGNSMLIGGNRGLILPDSTFVVGADDSARIFSAPQGALSDLTGNAPETLAYWTPIRFGVPPIWISVEVPKPLLVDKGQEIPRNEPTVTVLVRKSDDVPVWTPLPGGVGLSRPVDDYASVVVTLNRIPTEGGMYIYDRLGVAVAKVELDGLKAADAAGLIDRTRQGDFQILLAWNGCDSQGRKVASGIYLARVLAWFSENGQREAVNVVRTIGVRRKIPSGF